jgi:WD40 repeat protein
MKQNEAKEETREYEPPRGVTLMRTLEGHQDVIWSIAFNPDGRTIASGNSDKTINLWEVDTGNLARTLKGHLNAVISLSFDPTGTTLASGSRDNTLKLWDVGTGQRLRTLKAHQEYFTSITLDYPAGVKLASGGGNGTVKLWEITNGRRLLTLNAAMGRVWSVAFDPSGRSLASSGGSDRVNLWEVSTGRLVGTFSGHGGEVHSVAFAPDGQMLVSGSNDRAIRIWDTTTGKLLSTLEGHTDIVNVVSFFADGRLLASMSIDGIVRIWNCQNWETVAVISPPTGYGGRAPGRWKWRPPLACHATLPLLATIGSRLDAPRRKRCNLIHLWELDLNVLLDTAAEIGSSPRAVHHTTAKIVLVGDSGVGKTGLGWRLAHGEFREHASTHGQQFWILHQLSVRRLDGTDCEAIIWDLAGQSDYRLTHALFVDDADLALVLLDPTDSRDPLHGVEFWLKHFQIRSTSDYFTHVHRTEGNKYSCPILLIGARVDRGTPTLTDEELRTYCELRGISAYLSTSAKDGEGVDNLISVMQDLIRWEEKAATVTTFTFKRIKDYVMELKESPSDKPLIVTPEELRQRLEAAFESKQENSANKPLQQEVDGAPVEVEHLRFTDAEMLTAVGHLENYGYVKQLRTSSGETRILLTPELLNNLASSFVLEARRNPKGLGSLEEARLLASEYQFRELEGLSSSERDVLLDSATLLFLEHHVCFRETDPLTMESYLIFPELINLKKPVADDDAKLFVDGLSYTVNGAVENVYASLVVLLGYTQTFTRTAQWHNQAQYEVGGNLLCGFRQEASKDGELDFVLYFGTNVGKPVRMLFQGLFESFLARHNLTVFRYEPVVCAKCRHALNRSLGRDRLRAGKDFAFCPECGEKMVLAKADEPIQLTKQESHSVEEQQWFATQRSRFEQAIFQVLSHVEARKIHRPECFIRSYLKNSRAKFPAWHDAKS